MNAKQTRDKILQAVNVNAVIEVGGIEGLDSRCDKAECPDCEVGSIINILGTMHHVTFVKVKKGTNAQYEGQMPVGRTIAYDAMVQSDPGGNFQEVRLPGYKGRYVCIITPFQK